MTASINNTVAEEAGVLIILTGALGDVTRGMCMVKPLKRFWPEKRLVWLVENKWAGLLRLNPYIDELVIFNRSKSPKNIKVLKKELNRCQYALSLDLQRIFKSGFFTWLAGAQRKIGFNRKNAKEFNWLFNQEHIPFYPDTLPKLEHYLKFLDYLGVPYPQKPDFGLDDNLLAQALPAQIKTLNKPFIVLAAGSSWPSKDWHVSGYQQLARHLYESKGFTSVITGDKSQTGVALDIMADGAPYYTDLTGQTSLPQLAAVLSRAQLAIGPDSGTGHIAAANGTPYISLFGPTSPHRTAPYGYENLVVQFSLGCAPCYKRTCPDNKCMRQIGLAEIDPKIALAVTMKA